MNPNSTASPDASTPSATPSATPAAPPPATQTTPSETPSPANAPATSAAQPTSASPSVPLVSVAPSPASTPFNAMPVGSTAPVTQASQLSAAIANQQGPSITPLATVPTMTNVSVNASMMPTQPVYVGHQGHTVYSQSPAVAQQTTTQTQPTAAAAKVKFESALDFLEKVKTVFEDRPMVYARFLDIMKEFKAHTIDTPGVIMRVKQLFQGHSDLILGFNTFLPPGYKITTADLDPMQQQQQHPDPAAYAAGMQMNPHLAQQHVQHAQQQHAQQAQQVQAQQGQVAAGAEGVRKPEFDHARNYVKKIKLRFANEPHVYKAFLEILHTYHKEQQPIQDVYNQVARLFRNHEDLLNEFTQFLPDPNARMPTYAELMNRDRMPMMAQSAHLSARHQTLHKQQVHTQQPQQQQHEDARGRPKGRGAAPVSKPSQQPPSARGPSVASQAATTTAGAGKRGAPGGSAATFSEVEMLVRIKLYLGETRWGEFLKLLELFNNEVLTRAELLFLARDLLNQNTELQYWLRRFLRVDEAELSDDEPFLGGLDLNAQEQSGLSYRRRPEAFQNRTTSGRGELERSVLNDDWISRPMGEEGGTFKNSLKNEWEELLFRCEDDRFEWDMLVQRSASCAARLRQLQHRLSENPAQTQLGEHDLGPLHVKALRTVYAARADEILRLLREHPRATIPVVLARLQQKEDEWAKLRQHWGAKWLRVQEENWAKSFDHASFYYRTQQRRELAVSALVDEARRAPGHTLTYSLSDEAACHDLRAMLTLTAARELAPQDREKLDSTLLRALDQLFGDRFAAAPPPPLLETLTSQQNAQPLNLPDVRPLTVARPAPDGAQPSPSLQEGERVMFVNTALYVLLRYICIFYSRLVQGRQWAAKPENRTRYAPPTQHPPDAPPPAPVVRDAPDLSERAVAERTATLTDRIARLCAGLMEEREFEDEVRSLLGVQAVPVIVLERLVRTLGLQLFNVHSHSGCARLIQLFLYQQQRRDTDEAAYHANAAEIVAGKKLWRVVVNIKTGEMRVTLLDPRVPAQPLRGAGESKSKERDDDDEFSAAIKTLAQDSDDEARADAAQPYAQLVGAQGVHPAWEEHYRSLVDGDALTAASARTHAVCLQRNVARAQKELGAGSAALAHTVNINRLACRLDAQSLRPHYIEASEDLFFRQRPASSAEKRRPAVGKRSLEDVVAAVAQRNAAANASATPAANATPSPATPATATTTVQ